MRVKISDEFIRETRPTMPDLINYVRRNGLYDIPPEEFEDFVAQRLEAVRKGTASISEMRLRDGRVIQYQIRTLPDGGRMLTDVKEKMFDPFFTTKPTRRGHGAWALDLSRHRCQAA